MLLKSVFFTILIVTLIENGSCSCSDSEYRKLRSCYNDYFYLLKTTYSNYFYALDSYFYTPSSVDTLCSYYRSLQSCLGKSVIYDCVNHDEFYDLYGSSYSYDFSSNYYELEFVCGSGYKALKNEFYCLMNLKPSCNENINTCSQAKDYISCYANAAKKSCGQDGYYYYYNELSIEACHSDLQCNTCTNGGEIIGFSLIATFASVISFFVFKY